MQTAAIGITTVNVSSQKKSRVIMAERSNRVLSLKQWLAKYGKEPCDGCFYFIAPRCQCTYKKGYCVRYDEYKARQKGEED